MIIHLPNHIDVPFSNKPSQLCGILRTPHLLFPCCTVKCDSRDNPKPESCSATHCSAPKSQGFTLKQNKGKISRSNFAEDNEVIEI